MSLLWRKPCSLSCLAVFAVIVLVACSSGPGVAAPTVKDGAGKILAATLPLKVDETSKPVSLSGVFTGASLEYSTASSDEAVATAAIANGTLTITAHKAGPATITVTAKNAGGSAKYEVKVTVTAKSSGPGPGTGAAPTVKDAAPTTFGIDEGETEEVDLSDVFEGEGLTYPVAPESDDTDVAIAAIDDDVLIIRAGDPGEATITVIAKNAKGEAEHEITVTVSSPDDGAGGDGDPGDQTPPQPSATCTFPQTTELTIERTDHIKCTLPEGYTLNRLPGAVLTLDQRPDGETENVWLIQADKKGTHTITVFNEARKRAGTITVTVPNTPPNRNPGSHPEDQSITSSKSSIAVDIRSFFSDEDTEDYTESDNKLRYRVQTKPDWVLVESTDEGFVSYDDTSGNITLEVLEPMGKEGEEKDFPISIYAVDNSGDESNRPVRIVVKVAATGVDPRPGEYSAQQLSNGALHRDSALDVGPRFLRDTGTAVHTLTFSRVEGGPGFTFSANYVTGLIAGKRLNPAGDSSQVTTNAALFIYKDRDNNNRPSPPIPEWDSNTSLGMDYYLLESTGVVKAKWPTDLASTDDSDVKTISGAPEIEFKLTGRGSGMIRISYHVVALASKSEEDLFPTVGGRKTSTPVSTLTLRVVTCESPPNELMDCPGYTTG